MSRGRSRNVRTQSPHRSGVAVFGLDEPALGGLGRRWELEAGDVGLADQVEPVLDGVAQVPLAGGGGPVPGGPQQLDERDLVGRQRPVQLLGVGVVGVTARDDAGPAGAARADRQKCAVEPHAFAGQPSRLGSGWSRGRRAAIVPGHVVGVLLHVVETTVAVELPGSVAHPPRAGAGPRGLHATGFRQHGLFRVDPCPARPARASEKGSEARSVQVTLAAALRGGQIEERGQEVAEIDQVVRDCTGFNMLRPVGDQWHARSPVGEVRPSPPCTSRPPILRERLSGADELAVFVFQVRWAAAGSRCP